ncbi:MAG: 4'-phosphopantetheinyl transferase superfamily protein [Paramuribaculum sp.]|nr:4'-phosphopantetheinyl transferase superfamily protein [Paramuribaculum sp.]
MPHRIYTDLPPSPFTMGEAMVYHAPIKETERGSGRRDAERAAVARLVAEAFGEDAELGHDIHGAPYIAGRRDVYISVSHCRGLAVLAVSRRGRIGIDVEEENMRLERIAGRFLSPEEQLRWGGSIPSLAYAWTAKEAAFKALGIPDLVITEIAVGDSEVTARGFSAGLIHRSFGPLHITLSSTHIPQ